MKVKCNQFYLTEIFSEGSVYERFITKDKEYIVLAIQYISGTRGVVLVSSDYLYRPIWLPLQGLEITDDYIPSHWVYIRVDPNDGEGFYYISNELDINILTCHHATLGKESYISLAKELQEIKKQTLNNNDNWPKTIENKMTVLMDKYGLKKFTPEVYNKIFPSKLEIFRLVNEIESYVDKYQLSKKWLYFTNQIKNECKKNITDPELAKIVRENLYFDGEGLDMIHASGKHISDEKHRFQVNNALGLIVKKLIYCCDYLLAKDEYLYLFDES